MLISQFADGQRIDVELAVHEREVRTRRDGSRYLRLLVGDDSGAVEAMVWEGVDVVAPACPVGARVRLRGHFCEHPEHGRSISVVALQPPGGEVFLPARVGAGVGVPAGAESIAGFGLGSGSGSGFGREACEPVELSPLPGPPRSAEQMEADLRALLATVQDPFLGELLEGVFGADSPTWRAFRDAPAAKRYHQAYRHGLLEHSLSVAQAVSAISATFPGIDRDVAVTGALVHDIGKLEAYASDALGIEMTDLGKLQGEIALGYHRIRSLIEAIDGFPQALAVAVLHIILSHHGSLEHGSPVLPCTREATLVHMIDNLGGRLGSFDRLERELVAGEHWSPFDRALGGGAWFGAGRDAAAAHAA